MKGLYLSDHASPTHTEALGAWLLDGSAVVTHAKTTLFLVLMRVRGGRGVRVVGCDGGHCCDEMG